MMRIKYIEWLRKEIAFLSSLPFYAERDQVVSYLQELLNSKQTELVKSYSLDCVEGALQWWTANPRGLCAHTPRGEPSCSPNTSSSKVATSAAPYATPSDMQGIRAAKPTDTPSSAQAALISGRAVPLKVAHPSFTSENADATEGPTGCGYRAVFGWDGIHTSTKPCR